MVDFGGWELPVQYTGILAEHNAVRTAAGLFDVSHMGEIFIKGNDAESFIQMLITNDIKEAGTNQWIYSPMCNRDGGVVDDLIIYKFSKEKYMIVANAANIEKDYEWMTGMSSPFKEVYIENISAYYSQLAIQGPLAESVISSMPGLVVNGLKYSQFMETKLPGNMDVIVSRSGYTGEDGFEIYTKNENVPFIWNSLLDKGDKSGLVPAGLGARDVLRLEAALPLYGNELSESITPLEAGLSAFIKFDKGSFMGREALLSQKERGLSRKRAGFIMLEQGIARSNYEILSGDRNIGFVTSGSYSPGIGKNIGLCIIDIENAIPDKEFDVVIRGKKSKAKVVRTPFYKKSYKRI